MNIGVVGAGMIGGTVGVLWAKAGHLIRFATRHPDSLGPLLAEAGPNASASTPEEAARFGEIVFCSIPYRAWPAEASAPATIAAPANSPSRSSRARSSSIRPIPIPGAGVPFAQLLPGAG